MGVGSEWIRATNRDARRGEDLRQRGEVLFCLLNDPFHVVWADHFGIGVCGRLEEMLQRFVHRRQGEPLG